MIITPFDPKTAAPERIRRPRRVLAAVAAPVIVSAALPYWFALFLFAAGWLAIDSVRLMLAGADHLGQLLGD